MYVDVVAVTLLRRSLFAKPLLVLLGGDPTTAVVLVRLSAAPFPPLLTALLVTPKLTRFVGVTVTNGDGVVTVTAPLVGDSATIGLARPFELTAFGGVLTSMVARVVAEPLVVGCSRPTGVGDAVTLRHNHDMVDDLHLRFQI